MNANVRASKRKMKMKDESSTIHAPKKWSEDDIEKYLHCIMENGHKNFEKLQECFPDKSLEVIKTFLRTTFDTAIRREDGHPTLDGWINHCKGMTDEPAWKDSVQIARAIKYLSVDGLIENHPLPSHCQGVNFAEAYQLIYQALMGYPIQPVNQQTADFVLNCFIELAGEIKKQIIPTQNIADFLKKHNTNTNETKAKVSNKLTSKKNDGNIKENPEKPLKVYQRKKPKLTNEDEVPSLKIVVEENDKASCSGAIKDFSITIDGSTNGNAATVLNIPVPVRMDSLLSVDKNEKELLESVTYNPFKIPERWLKEPFYINLLSKNFDK